MLGRVQRGLEALYRVSTGVEVDDFVVGAELRDALVPARRPREQLLVSEADGEVALALFIDPSALANLTSHDPSRRQLACVLADAHRESPEAVRGDVGERRREAHQVRVAGILAARFPRHAIPHPVQVDTLHRRRVAHQRRRAKHEAVDEREHRRVGADAEREREHHARGECGAGAEAAQRHPGVLPQGLK